MRLAGGAYSDTQLVVVFRPFIKTISRLGKSCFVSSSIEIDDDRNKCRKYMNCWYLVLYRTIGVCSLFKT